MRKIQKDGRVVGIELTRRNLQALLTKLNGHPSNSACTIEKEGVYVRAVENSEHYSDTVPGRMHDDTELAMQGVF